MDTASGSSSLHSSCRHDTGRDAKDAVSGQPVVEQALVADPLSLPEPPLPRGAASTATAPDARGAPHLTVVIRI